MASPAEGVETLSDQQRSALEQYTAVTAQDVNKAIPLLARCEWNVQIAIARFFDGEPAPEPEPVAPAPESIRRQETLLNAIPTSTSRPLAGTRNLVAAPRIVGTPESQLNAAPPLLLALSLAPLNILLGLFSRIYSVVSSVAPFIPTLLSRIRSRLTTLSTLHATGARRPDLGPQATADRFVRDFQSTYGEHALPLLSTSYARAYDKAKAELKFLLVVPLSPEHQHTDAFVRGVLLSEPVTQYICNSPDSMLVWAGSTADAETFAVASALGVTQFPAAILIAHTPGVSATAMSIVAHISGAATTPASFRRALEAAVSQHSGPLGRARAAKQDQQATRTLREEQQSAYERSLAKDRERARAKREAEQAATAHALAEKQAAERAAQHAANLAQWRAWRAARIGPEPPAAAAGAARISVRMLDGARVVRRFARETPLAELYALVECHGADAHADEAPQQPPDGFEPEHKFRLVGVLPRVVYGLEEGGTVGERIGRSGNLVAERIEDGDGDGDGDGNENHAASPELN